MVVGFAGACELAAEKNNSEFNKTDTKTGCEKLPQIPSMDGFSFVTAVGKVQG